MSLGNPVAAAIDNVGIGAVNPGASKLYTYGSVTEVATTLQNGGWIDLAQQAGFMAEIIQSQGVGGAGTGYMGAYGVQVSNDQSNIYTVLQDNNPTIIQNCDYAFLNKQRFRYVRPYAKPVAGNTGTLNIQIKTFGPDADVSLSEQGIADLGPVNVLTQTAAQFTAAITNQIDFKIPAGYTGVEFWINCTALTGTSFTPTFYKKDPVSGLYISIGTGVAVTGTGITVVKLAKGLTAASGVFSDTINAHMAVTVAVSAFTSAAMTITAVFTR